MASYDTVNYSLRPNKAIQRQIVFDGLERLDRSVPLGSAAYIGFGSIWFADFILAHRKLGVSDMISIENKPIGAVRGRFNAPFRTVTVEQGDSGPVLSLLVQRSELVARQWIVWLDYDGGLSPEVLDDVRTIITHAAPNSVLLLTLPTRGLGQSPSKRESYVRSLLGAAVSDDLTARDFDSDKLQKTLIDVFEQHIVGQAVQLGRPGGFVPAFRVPYSDSTPMITLGGVLPAPAAVSTVRASVSDSHWPGCPPVAVEAPPLTLKEVTALQQLLPSRRRVSRSQLRRLGFDLEDEQLATYCEHYRRYPAFVQIVN
jgi:hypothetical protein